MSNGNERWRSAAGQIIPRLAAIGLLLLAWWATVATGVFSSNVLPSPGAVLQAFMNSFLTPDPPRESILQAAQASLIRLVVGLSVGIVVGTIIGLAMAASTLVQRSIGSLMAGLQALPSIAWLPLAILWFGLSEKADPVRGHHRGDPRDGDRVRLEHPAGASAPRSAPAGPSALAVGCSSAGSCSRPPSPATSVVSSRRGRSRGGR